MNCALISHIAAATASSPLCAIALIINLDDLPSSRIPSILSATPTYPNRGSQPLSTKRDTRTRRTEPLANLAPSSHDLADPIYYT